jgi:hypothetical protein
VIGAPLPRWAPVVLLLAVNLLPLWLVLDGKVETPDLLMAYAVETCVLLLLALPRVPGMLLRLAGQDLRMGLGGGALALGVVLSVGFLTDRVAAQVTWDRSSWLVLAGVGGSLAFGLWLGWRRHGSPVPGRRAAFGAFAWRYLLLVVGARIGLDAAESYEHLLERGWEPAALGDGWAYPVGNQLIEGAISLDVPSAVIPAFFLVLVRTVNEVLHEVYLVCRELDEADAEDAPAGARAAVD